MNLTDLIYRTLENENKFKRQQTAHYPSSASYKFVDGTLVGPDLLMQYLKWKGVPPSNPSDAVGLLKMKLGDGAHKELARILNKAEGIRILTELPAKYLAPGLKKEISLRVDHLIENTLLPATDGSRLFILEVKSSMQQQMFAKGWGIKTQGPKLDHLLQVICYIEIIPKTVPGFSDLRSAKLLYVDRGTGGLLEFNIIKATSGHYSVFDSEGKLLPVLENQRVEQISFEGIISRWATLENLLEGASPIPEYRAWLNESTGEVMDTKTIKGQTYKTPWRVLYSEYKDYIWKNPANYQHSYNALGPVDTIR
jgi:hypothetical protein